MRYFNTEGCCKPDQHYMVDLNERLNKIKKSYVDRGKYFVINKGRQYGKTTTLTALEQYLKTDYLVISLDFQLMGSEDFSDETVFSRSMAENFIFELKHIDVLHRESLLKSFEELNLNLPACGLRELFIALSNMCKSSPKPVVLLIDEVDSASNNQVFIDFLAQLRGYYLKRDKMPIFHSVILAGVYDIKNLKLKLRSNEAHQYNSPWNIAARFTIGMSFSPAQIADMLNEYERDRHIGMDTGKAALEIYQYTSGYPYLVSAICKYLDEEIGALEEFKNPLAAWSKAGIAQAVKMLLKENIPLFDSIVKQLDAYPKMRDLIEQIIYRGRQISFSPAEKSINQGLMFGFLKEKNGYVAIHNRIFEMYMLNLFISEESMKSDMFIYGQDNKSQFISGFKLNMDLILEKFVEYFTEIYGENDLKFIENYGRKFFLLYLKPIINGTGNYYLEAQTRDARRTDVIVDYHGEQFIIEMKIWRGNEYNERGEQQLIDYLNYYHKEKGYMLSFNKNKRIGVKEIPIGNKIIVEAVV